MKFKHYILAGLTALSFSGIMTTSSITASAHDYFWWQHPRWVTTTKTTRVAKIKNVYPLAYSRIVKIYTVRKGAHLRINHSASHYWLVTSRPFKTNGYYTYSMYGKNSHWFKLGIR